MGQSKDWESCHWPGVGKESPQPATYSHFKEKANSSQLLHSLHPACAAAAPFAGAPSHRAMTGQQAALSWVLQACSFKTHAKLQTAHLTVWKARRSGHQ